MSKKGKIRGKTRRGGRTERAPAKSAARQADESLTRHTDLPRWMNGLSLIALALVLLYRPVKSGVVREYGGDALFGTILLIALVAWFGGLLLDPKRRVKLALPLAGLLIWLALTLLSLLSAHYLFPALHQFWLILTYGLILFLVVQHAADPLRRRFLVAVLVATVITLTAYAVFHYQVYMAAMRRWLETDPAYFKSMLGLGARMAEDFEDRIRTRRAYGNYLTPNQLADFLILGFFLTLYAGADLVRRRRLYLAFLLPVLLLQALALALTKSKGGIVAFFGALVLFGLLSAWQRLQHRLGRRGRLGVLAAMALVLILFAGAVIFLIAMPQNRVSQAMQRSLSVRLGYWRITVQIIETHPALGVGPGNWNDWYSLLKAPWHEETQLPHSDYLQIAAESGVPAAVAYIGFWALVLVPPILLPSRRGASAATAPSPANKPAAGQGEQPERVRRLMWGGIILAALMFTFDHAIVGTMRPPRSGTGALLERHPWVPAFIFCLLWVGLFAAMFHPRRGTSAATPPSERWRHLRTRALVAGLAGFLIHSAAEFNLVIPGIGTLVFSMAALALLRNRRAIKCRRPSMRAGLVIFAALALGTGLFTVLVTQRVLNYQFSRDIAFSLRSRVRTDRPNVQELRKAIDALRDAVRNVPLDAETQQELGDYYLLQEDILRYRNRPDAADEAGQRALEHYEEALELNAWKAKFHVSLGRWYARHGRMEEAAEAFLQAARRSPSRPTGWFLFADTAMRVEGLSPRVKDAFVRALELNPLQYHKRNRLTERQIQRAQQAVKDSEN